MKKTRVARKSKGGVTEAANKSTIIGRVPEHYVEITPRPINACMECDKDLAEGQTVKLCGECTKKVSATTRNALRGCVKPEDLTSCVRCKNVCQDKRHPTLGGGYLCDSCNEESEMLNTCDWEVKPKPILEPGEQAPQASAELPKLMRGMRIAGTVELLGIIITVDLSIS